ncbi:AAA family ATPase [Tenacibaculum tangerinum]|uniref:AAA family ATPase n=1 Tax=Tenacibaculum tangerinum TaxID=3038772 RepID=A0ABY8L2Z0_9FLAO|nr:AAA family ATPase [Tenacibaculum tangerinum]WGH75636.1 AAA family ATPase [Tenacibaculum tangerinum]
MNIPTQHLSVRVPWHDSGWNGKVCCHPRDNGSCMFLPRINESKDVDQEEELAEQWMHELKPSQLPPCVGEKVHFMSPHAIYKKVNHPYSKNDGNSQFYGHYRETTYCYPGYSFSVIPYNWMLKDKDTNESDKAAALQLPFEPEKEPALNFKNSWVQQIDNQRLLLDTFIQPIRPAHSLVFIYAKNVPFIDTTARVLIGVGHISEIGKLTEYAYDDQLPKSFRSTLWERPVFHTIRDDFKNGFLLPYQEFFKLAEKDDSINIHDYIALAPSFEQFSYGTEWVSNDSAIESLLILLEKLRKFEQLLPDKNYEAQFKWIDKELSRLWKMRGPFPGLGAVLSGMKIAEGNLIAWELDSLVRDEVDGPVVRNPWDYIEKLFNGDLSFLPANVKLSISDTQKQTWNHYSKEEKDFLQFLSRMHIINDQVNLVIDAKAKDQKAYLQNPYLLYEHTRLQLTGFQVSTIDKAIFGDPAGIEKFPLPELCDLNTPLDQRRVRAFAVKALEETAVVGNTLLTDTQLITKLDEQPVEPLCNPSIRNLMAIADFMKKEVTQHVLDEEEEIYYFKLKRFDAIKSKIRNFVQKRLRRKIDPPIVQDWRGLIDQKFGDINPNKPNWYQERDKRARQEKANALEVLANSRVSVLIGPAGTGKTTLLNILCEQDFIKNSTVLRLAPTGKARVKMGADAKTLAQFLIQAKRYNPETGQYFMNPNAEARQYDTVIVDESSMLTEEQLAALLDSLSGVSRFILIGDYRQLPPIGAGRPFVDIKIYMEQQGKGIAELRELFRQNSDESEAESEPDRLDVRLSRWFSDDPFKKSEIDVFEEIGDQQDHDWGNIQFIEWHNVRHLEEILIDVTNREIEGLLSRTEGKILRSEQANFDASLGGNYIEEYKWTGFDINSAKEVENWQILSPTNTAGYGTKVINQKIQKTFRAKTKEKAIFPGSWTKNGKTYYKARKMPKPVADDGIVFGDKVINLKNKRWNQPWSYVFNPNNIDDENIIRYFANGEIGLHIGAYGKWDAEKKKYQRPIYIAFSSQQGFAYSFQEGDFSEDGDIQMDLAYSITVHKSQGSGFKVVLFILPNPCPVLSRELFYTALTRQEDRILILHQGDFKDYRKFTSGEYSETGRRLTDLMAEPQLKLINKKYYDTKYIQVSEKGEFMISKSEVIIADKLHNKGIQYVYEAPILDEKGVTIHPDFTIEDPDSGIIYYWEHLGLLQKDDYRSKWKRKQEWYERNGIVNYKENPDADKQLILTRDKPDGGIDSSEIKDIIEELFL